MTHASFDLLSELSAAPGVAGFEQPVSSLICNKLAALGVSADIDGLGNVVAHIAASPATVGAPTLLLVAHLDEVGYIVRKIRDDGFLLLERVGGASVHTLPGLRLTVWTEGGAIDGVVGALPQHLAGRVEGVNLTQMYLDIGAHSRDEALAMGAQVGCAITHHAVCGELNGRVYGKALDDRLGCLILLNLAARLTCQPPACNVYLSFVVQEETRLRGAVPVVNRVQPHFAIGVDATLAFDTPDLPDGQTDVRLGGGPAIKVMDHLRGQGQGFIAHVGLRRHIESVAARRRIVTQPEVVVGLTTAATPLPFLGAGLPSAAVSFPLRYSHSPLEMADWGDVDSTVALLAEVANEPWKGS